MNKETLKAWVKDTAIRTVKTAAEAAIGVIGAATMINEVDWTMVVATVALSAVTTILVNLTTIAK